MAARLDQIKEGTRVRLLPWPEEGIEGEEVGTVEELQGPDEWAIEPEGPAPMAIVRVDPEYRDEQDRDGLREVYFDVETLARTEVLS